MKNYLKYSYFLLIMSSTIRCNPGLVQKQPISKLNHIIIAYKVTVNFIPGRLQSIANVEPMLIVEPVI